MRHSTIKPTLDTYGHLLPGQDAEAVQGFGQFFNQREVRMTGTDDAPIRLDEGVRATLRATKRTETHPPRTAHANPHAATFE
jgi:hypothetical protein